MSGWTFRLPSIEWHTSTHYLFDPTGKADFAGGCEWSEDDRKLRVFSRYGDYTDIEWDPPEAVEEPILDLVQFVIGQGFDENWQMV